MASNIQPEDIIIALIEGAKNGKGRYDRCIGGQNITLYNCKYLLNQVLRHYKVPDERIHISVKAYDLWNKLTVEDIKGYEYAEIIPTDKAQAYLMLDIYKGSSTAPYKTIPAKGAKGIKFNDVFTLEHMVPIRVIVDELLNLNPLDPVEVRHVLDKIHLCRVLKEEDHRLKPKSKRPNTFQDVIKKVYIPAGVDIIYLQE